MKLSYRILFINFAIVALIIGSSAFAFYSIMYNVLSSQQSKYLINSSNDFSYFYREMLQNTEDDFLFLLRNNKRLSANDFQLINKNIDFIFETSDSSSQYLLRKFHKSFVIVPKYNFTIEKFLEANPYAILKTYKSDNGNFYYYGRIVTTELLTEISKKIGAETAVIWKGTPSEISNEQENQKFIYPLTAAYNNLTKKTEDKIYSMEAESTDILAVLFEPYSNFEKDNNLKYLIFTTLNEAVDLKSNLKYILITIGGAGILLSLILILVFTDKIRKQLSQLNEATELIKEDNFKNKIDIKSKDEIGKLAGAFNNMVDVLRKNQKVRNDYSEFITLINQNPTLTEIADAALRKIIAACDFTVGALYTTTDDQIVLTSSFGFGNDYLLSDKNSFFDTVLETKETLEFTFNENFPVVKTGTISIQIKYLLILPVIYNNEVIALLELGAAEKPAEETKEYLSNIQEQLAIGLTNATAFVRMENLVDELKILNENYQNQNIRISKQNETLVKLHAELKEKAEELSVQKQKAEASTSVKSQFLASMSHELRTPMNSILGLTELILEEPSLAKKNRERLQVVLNSGKRLMNLINDILDLSKIEAGKMDLHEENIFLDELLKEIETSVKPLAENKNLSFKVVKHSKTKIIFKTDKGKLTQVLMNLLGNAVKFTDEGKVELHVTTIEDNKLKFDVMDSGSGISEDDQKIIFEEFRQLDGSSTRKHSGTGLGLSICKKIANLLEGKLTLQSKVGSGSNFSFIIPLKLTDFPFAEKNFSSINVEVLKKNLHHPILVIDDDPEVRYTIGQYLVSKGYEVVYASTGEKGLEEARKIQPFAITLDVLLPQKDGWNILKELKQDALTKDIPVILVSIISDKKLGYGLGAFEYFIKPVSAEKLLSAFEKLESYIKRKINKVVLVDDDELEFEKFSSYLKDSPVKLDYIKDSEIAFNKILDIKPDLIILDLLMPKVDGITLANKLKANIETKNIPIIISTAKDLSEDEIKSLNKIVENVTLKSQRHPLDVLKIVRDRLNVQEISLEEDKSIISKEEAEVELIKTEAKPEGKNYFGEVLIVDDDPDTLFTISELVEACNCKPITAKNGIECLEKLNETIPDLILLDIMMPEMDGFQTIKKIRENEKFKDLQVFAVSAKAMSGDKSIIIKHGFNDFIPKPVNATIINYKLQKIFKEINIS